MGFTTAYANSMGNANEKVSDCAGFGGSADSK